MNRTVPSMFAAASATLILALAAFAGCVGATNDGHVSFFVKDAPSDELSSVFVTFSKVEIHKTGEKNESEKKDHEGDNQTDDDNETHEKGDDGLRGHDKANESKERDNETDDDNQTHEKKGDEADDSPDLESDGNDTDASDAHRGSWITVVNSTHTVDLKNFSGDAKDFLGGTDVPPGTYNQIRVYVDSAYGIKNGTRVNITVPSGVLKITHKWTVVEGQATVLTLDFDLAKSLIKTGDGKYILKPHMKIHIEKREKHEIEKEENEQRARHDQEERKKGQDLADDHRSDKSKDRGNATKGRDQEEKGLEH